jgi:hypothetical protein
MANAAQYYPGFKSFLKWYPQNLILPQVPVETGQVWFVDGDKSADGGGKTWEDAYKSIQSAIDGASSGDVIYIAARTITSGATDPISYEENLTIGNATQNLSLIGVSRGRTQGGLPQLKDGATTTQEILRIRGSGCLIANLGFNGAGNTGGGILLDESASGYVAFGTTIANCHFKNCKGATATDSRTGGAIMWTSNGGAWQSRITGCNFYKNVGDIILKGTSGSKPQDIMIDHCDFSPLGANTDCNVYGAGGSGFAYVDIKNCNFGQLPALGSGSVVRYYDLTGSTGMISGCTFGCDINATATELTFGTAGTGGKTPTTVRVANCWGETTTAGESGEINTA